ncbi:hypothetical protein ACUN13_29510 [Bacillus cereus group sp. Bce041]|uniref:hypothetical protein n=1 Tax=Bacillus cereus group sp. Bce041 TaxID=3445228 RepID=UPI0040435CA5
MEKIIEALKKAAATQEGLKQEIDLHNVLSECAGKGDIPLGLYKQIEEYMKETA